MTAELSPSSSNSPGIRLLKQIFRNRSAQIGGVLLLILIFISYAAPLFTDKDPNKTAPSVALRSPSLEFPMGTDGIGRDNFSRFLYGGRLSLRVGLVGITIGALIGITLGLISGYFGGWLDSFVSWFTDVLMAFPDILLALAIIAILGPGIRNAMLAIGISFVPSFMRLTRSSVLSLREMTYIEASRALGSSDVRILIRHILPNSVRTLLVLVTLGIGSSILAGAALSFLGLGAEPPTPEWGAMLNAGMKFVRQAWWLTVFPGAGIFLAVLSINLIGDTISDVVAGTTVTPQGK
jgi:ABC-type dipeptide/oligopeptide/nickel transport system permease subunit